MLIEALKLLNLPSIFCCQFVAATLSFHPSSYILKMNGHKNLNKGMHILFKINLKRLLGRKISNKPCTKQI